MEDFTWDYFEYLIALWIEKEHDFSILLNWIEARVGT